MLEGGGDGFTQRGKVRIPDHSFLRLSPKALEVGLKPPRAETH